MSIVCATERSMELIKCIVLICLLMGAAKCLQDDERKAMYGSYSYISPIIKEANVSKPQNLTCTLQSAYMINVTWDPPLVGIPKFYDIEWTCPDGYENPTPTIKTEYNMTDLLPCTQYAISVRSGDGTSESDPAEVKCETNPPSVSPPPTDVQITNLAPDNATLTWTVPMPRCLFVNYSITWEFESLWGEGQASGDGEDFTNSRKKRYIINDLTPYSNVTACVSAALSNTDFGKPSCASGITLSDIPGRPENMKHGNIAECKVNLTWSEPTEINGILGSWNLSLNIEDEEVLNVTLPPETRSYELLDLLRDTDYNVTLQASTEAGFGDAAFCIISTPALVDDDINLAAIIGGTVGVLLGIVVIVGVVFFGRKWKARKAESKHDEIRTESQMTHTPERNINKASNKEFVNGTKPFSNCSENQSRVTATSYDNQNFKMPSSDTTDDRGYKQPSTNAHEKQKIKRLMSENFNYQYIKRFSLTINETRNFRRPLENIDEIKDDRRPSVDTNESRNFRSRLEDNDEIYKAKKPSTADKKLKEFRSILTKGNEKFQQAFNRFQ